MTISISTKKKEDFDHSKVNIIKSFHPVGYWQDGFLGMKKRHLNGNHLITYTDIMTAQGDQLHKSRSTRIPLANCPAVSVKSRAYGQTSYRFEVKGSQDASSMISKKISPELVNLYLPLNSMIVIMYKGELYMEANSIFPTEHDIRSVWVSIRNRRNCTAVKWNYRIDEDIKKIINLKYAMAYEFERDGVAHLFIRGFNEETAMALNVIHVKRHANGKTDINEVLINIDDNEHDKRAVDWMMHAMKEAGNE